MKTITIRLYRQHDMDLISLYMNDGFNFTKAMKDSVIAMIANTPYTIKVPEYRFERQYIRRMYLLHVTFSSKESETIKKLSEVRQGQICSFFKASMRACLESFPYGAYFGGDGFTLSKAEETNYVNGERQKMHDNKKKQDRNGTKPADAEKKSANTKTRVPVEISDDATLPEPIPFENLPIPEPEGSYDAISDDEGMDLFDAINAVAGGRI